MTIDYEVTGIRFRCKNVYCITITCLSEGVSMGTCVPKGIPRFGIYGCGLFTIVIQSIIGHTERQRVQPVKGE